MHTGTQLQSIGLPAQHVVVVVALAKLPQARADGLRRLEIQGRIHHAGDGARRNQGLVHDGELAGVDHQLVAQDVAGALAREVPVAVVCQVHDRLLVRLGFVADV